MRSIRRSLLGYLLLLLFLALSGVMLLVDRIAQAAILAREQAETRRIQDAFVVRQKEARKEFDQKLAGGVRLLAEEVQGNVGRLVGQTWRPRGLEEPRRTAPEIRAGEAELNEYATRAAMLQLGDGLTGWNSALTAYAVDPQYVRVFTPPNLGAPRGSVGWFQRLNPTWAAFDSPRAMARLQEVLKPAFNDSEHSGYSQLTMFVSYPGQPGNRTVATVRSGRLPHDLPHPEVEPQDRPNQNEFIFDDVDVAGVGKVRRVVQLSGRRPLVFPVYLTYPSVFNVAPLRAVLRPHDVWIRVYVHHARPYSELMDSLAEEREAVEAQLLGVHDSSEQQLADLHRNLLAIGAVTFLALVLGGWIIVARGLAPVEKLSDAVSQVSEKDFRLPVELTEMSRELAPVHRRLTETLDQLREAFAREKQSVADISHELRTPIASLLATIDVSLRKPRTPEQYRTTLEDCRSIAKQLGQLVERIMTLASLDAGTAHTACCLTDASELAAGCAAVIRPLAESHGVTLQLEIEDGLELNTDRDKLREVLMNLLHNGVEYNQPGGRLDLKAARDGDSIVFEVRDTGIGIPPELREKIFERFFRADSSRHATGVHAGLGLAIVKEYIQRLNGTITLESEPEVGSTFRVRLPAAVCTNGEADHSSVVAAEPAQAGESAPPAKDRRLNRRTLNQTASSGS